MNTMQETHIANKVHWDSYSEATGCEPLGTDPYDTSPRLLWGPVQCS